MPVNRDAGGSRPAAGAGPDAFATLERMTSALAGVRSTVEALGVIAEQCIPAMGASSGCLALMDERSGGLRVEATAGSGGGYSTGQSLTLDAPVLLCQAARSGATLVADEQGRVIAAPLRVARRVVGAVQLEFPRGGEGRQLVGAATALWALAVGRARTYDAERAARSSLREATNRLAFLAESTRTLNESLELGETLARLARLAVPRLGDVCAIHLLRAGAARLTASAHRDPEASHRTRVWLRGRGGLGQSSALRAAVDTASTTVVQLTPPGADPRQLASSEKALRVLRDLDLATVAVVPLSVHGRVLGTMTLATERSSTTAEPDLLLAEEIGIRAGTAIERAQLYEEQARAISQLQASLLPPVLPQIGGLDLANAFVPASRFGDVGGDFYDAFRRRDGTVLLVIGDVQGKGLAAAATTGLVRQSVRAAAVSAAGPSDVVGYVNEVLLEAQATSDEPNQLCTLCVLTVRVADGQGAELTLTCGGHPLPLLVPASDPVTRVGRSELLVGAFEDAAWTETRTRLGPGDALLCVTDGVTERRHEQRFFEDELDSVVLSARGGSAGDLVEAVRVRAMAFSDARPSDDMALLAVKVPDTASAGSLPEALAG